MIVCNPVANFRRKQSASTCVSDGSDLDKFVISFFLPNLEHLHLGAKVAKNVFTDFII